MEQCIADMERNQKLKRRLKSKRLGNQQSVQRLTDDFMLMGGLDVVSS